MSHTKGPWSAWAADDGGFEIYGSGEPDYMVLCSRNPNKDRAAEMISNARLIAAAPLMLDALRKAVLPLAFLSERDPAYAEAYRAVNDAIAVAVFAP